MLLLLTLVYTTQREHANMLIEAHWTCIQCGGDKSVNDRITYSPLITRLLAVKCFIFKTNKQFNSFSYYVQLKKTTIYVLKKTMYAQINKTTISTSTLQNSRVNKCLLLTDYWLRWQNLIWWWHKIISKDKQIQNFYLFWFNISWSIQ